MYARLYHEGGIYIYIYRERERERERERGRGGRNYDEWHFEISKCTARKIMGGRV
jgi:hypothetical protein